MWRQSGGFFDFFAITRLWWRVNGQPKARPFYYISSAKIDSSGSQSSYVSVVWKQWLGLSHLGILWMCDKWQVRNKGNLNEDEFPRWPSVFILSVHRSYRSIVAMHPRTHFTSSVCMSWTPDLSSSHNRVTDSRIALELQREYQDVSNWHTSDLEACQQGRIDRKAGRMSWSGVGGGKGMAHLWNILCWFKFLPRTACGHDLSFLNAITMLTCRMKSIIESVGVSSYTSNMTL